MRPSDSAILTPLAKNDSVLNHDASNNIWDMANNPVDFIRDNLKTDNIIAGVNQGSSAVYSQTLENVTFHLPNVKNYNELLDELKTDKNFERLLLSMTIDRIDGKSSLAKGKAVR